MEASLIYEGAPCQPAAIAGSMRGGGRTSAALVTQARARPRDGARTVMQLFRQAQTPPGPCAPAGAAAARR